MKYLITGGAGFIGSCFCRYMIDKYPKNQYVCVDALTYASNIDSLKDLLNKENFKFIHENICNKDKIDELFKNESFDYVINFAAETHVDRSIQNPSIFIETNVIGTQILIDACLKYKVKRFHQVSTDEVYGDLPLDRPDLLFTEDTKLNPSSPYSASKASADLLVSAYHRTYNLPCTISRCSNNYGPYQNEEKLIPLIIKKALANESIPIYGNGLNVRDWLYVYDHCEAIDVILTKGQIGEIYNIGSNNEISNIDIAKRILDLLNKSHNLITYVEDRPGHDLRYAINPSKLEKLGWKPKNSFDEAIKSTIEFYK